MVDINKPVENPELKDLLNQWAQSHDDIVLDKIFKRFAMNAHLLSVVTFSPPPAQQDGINATIEPGTSMDFPVLTTPEQVVFFPAFTDWEELHKWDKDENPQTMVLNFDDYVAIVLKSERLQGVVINPFGASLVLDRQLLEHLKIQKEILTKGFQEQIIERETEVQLFIPEELPTGLLEALCDQMANEKNIARAWILNMKKHDEESFLLVIDFTGDKTELFPRLAVAARDFLGNNYLDMIPYETEFGKDAVREHLPFYSR